jgi:hypothetical protein
VIYTTLTIFALKVAQDAMVENVSLEEPLLFVVFLYIALPLLFGFWKGRKYLLKAPRIGEDYFAFVFHSDDLVLALAGFSLTALSLFIGLYQESIGKVASILLFFSISFSLLILSATFSRFHTRRIFAFIGDLVADAGLLGLACGFLVFFWQTFQWLEGIVVIYAGFIAIFILLSFLHFYKYHKLWLVTSESCKKN